MPPAVERASAPPRVAGCLALALSLAPFPGSAWAPEAGWVVAATEDVSVRYGCDAHVGALDLVTRRPGEARKVVRFAAGERDSGLASASWAGPVSATQVAMSGGVDQGRGFARSRVTETEYPGAPRERLPLTEGGERVSALGMELEHDLAPSASLRLAAGTASIAGTLTHSELDRQQVVDAAAPWMRFDVGTASRRLHASWSGYRSRRQRALGLGRERWIDADRYSVEVAGEREWSARARVDGGVAVHGEVAGSRDARGRETWLGETIRDSLLGLWGSSELDLGRHARATLGARIARDYDGDLRLSPQLGVAYGFSSAHTLHLHAGRGLLRPSAEQRALAVALQEPLDLSPLQDAYGLDLGFDSVPVLALGNPRLRPETVDGVEAGYRGGFGRSGRSGRRVRLDFDVHHSRHRDVVSSLLPGVAAAYPRYTVPASVPPELAALFLETLARFVAPGIRAGLVSLPDGSPAVVQSFANGGDAVVRGADLGVHVAIAEGWEATLAYSLLDFEPERTAPGDVLVANAPDHRVAATIAYAGPALRVATSWRWQPEFEWSAAGARGVVPEYSELDLAASRRIGMDWEVGASVTNLFDDRHYETFGGDVLRRRALLTVARSWR